MLLTVICLISNRPNIIVNSSYDSVCSVENVMEIINILTINSLSRSHSFFNKCNGSSNSTTENRNNYSCSQLVENPLNVLSDVVNIDHIEAHLNVGTETDAYNCDAFVIAHSSRESNETSKERENIQPLSLSKNYIDVVPKETIHLCLHNVSRKLIEREKRK